MLHFDAMPEDTLTSLKTLSEYPLPGRFILAGETALAMYWRHRISEDLDLASYDEVLRDQQINPWLDLFSPQITEVTSLAAIADAENAGEDLRQSQRDYKLHSTKVTLFCCPECTPFLPKSASEHLGNIPVADTNTIFYLKVAALLNRHKSRDTFDLATYIHRGEKSIHDIVDAMKEVHAHTSVNLQLMKLTTNNYPQTDEGFEQLTLTGDHDAPPFDNIKTLSEFMQDQVAEYARSVSSELVESHWSPDQQER